MAEITQISSLGAGTEIIMSYDDITLLLTNVYINNQSAKRIVINVDDIKKWSYVILPKTVLDKNILVALRPQASWKELPNPNSELPCRWLGGFNWQATLGD